MAASGYRSGRHGDVSGRGRDRGNRRIAGLARIGAISLFASLLAVISLGLQPASAACSEGKSADGICEVFSAGSVREGSSLSFTVPLPEQWAALSGGNVSFDNHGHGNVDARYGVELAGDRDEFVYASKCNAPHTVVILDDSTWGQETERGEDPDFSSVRASGRRITVRARTDIYSVTREPALVRYQIHGRQTIRIVENDRVTNTSTRACIVTGRGGVTPNRSGSGYSVGTAITSTAVAEIAITRSSSASNPALAQARENRPGTQRSNTHTPGAYVPPNTNRCTVVDFGNSQMSWCGTFITDGVEYAPDGTPLSEICDKKSGAECTKH